MIRHFVSSLVLLGAAPAFAQSENTSDSAPGGLEEVIVTAARREESTQKSALSIQAIGAEALTRAGVTQPEDLNAIAPGVAIGSGGNFPQVYIRGVGNYGTNAYAEGAVALNLDGVYMSRPWSSRGAFFDLDRVEVLKGPQGTLYGRNASGGAINLISARPTQQAGGYFEGEAGDYNLYRATGAYNIPISETFALRAAGQIIRRDGYLSDDYSDERSEAARLHALWRPADGVSLLLTGGYQHLGGNGEGSVLNPGLPGDRWRGNTDPAVTAILRAEPGIGGLLPVPDRQARVDIDVYTATAELNWAVGPGTLTILPAYRDSKLSDATYVPGFRVSDNEHDRQTSVEARYAHESDNLKFVAGAFYFNEDQSNLNGRRLLDVEQGVNAQLVPTFDSNIRSYAGFGQATFSVTEQFRVTGGLRYTDERKEQDGVTISYGFPSATPPPPCAGVAQFTLDTPSPPLFCATTVPLVGTLNYESWTYRGGVEFDVSPESLLYGGVSTGFKSGGFFAAPVPNTFRPEKLTSYEVGWKNRLLDNRLQLNVETFYWEYKDHQETHLAPSSIPGFFVFATENAGRATLYGADLDTAFLFTPNDRINLKVQYEHSVYDEFRYSHPTAAFGPPSTGCDVGPLVNGSQTVDCKGFQVVRAPEWSGTAGYDHTFRVGNGGSIIAGAQAQFASSSWLSIDFLPQLKQDSYTVFDVDLRYVAPADKWSVSAFVHNVGNEAVLTQGFHYPFTSPANPLAPGGLYFATIRPPRTYGAQVRINF